MWLTLECVFTTLLTKCLLTVVGFGRTLKIANGRPMIVLGRTSRHIDVPTITRRLATVAAFYPGRFMCLERAVALQWLLRRHAFPARIRVGVQPYGFIAHAWVECDGQPVDESLDRLQRFIPFPEILT